MSAMEHDEAVLDARQHLEASAGPPLLPLPPGYAAARAALHRVAEDVLKAKRELETGNEIALRYTPGGFGTPAWEAGVASGTGGQARVEGTDLVVVTGDAAERTPLEGAAADAAAAAAVADWFAFGTVVLAAVIESRPGTDPAPIRLWPEHFDVATDLGDEPAGTRATIGASPGDELHDEPYLYASPWSEQPAGPLWNARGFNGAELGYAELLAAPDQLAAAAGFFARRLDSLG
ncbi:MAG: hypothetical protein U0R51_03005 [Solirubrobacterales bacterium]